MGIIVSALEIVEAGFVVVDIAPVAQGVVGAQGAGHGTGGAEDVAPGTLGILYSIPLLYASVFSYFLVVRGHIASGR